ncbi:hypothetical protein [Tomitella biformata]|uniref:hypothetical protein n=1 Tax=Tomitella biformata TaxID=630403 RepID=UPI000467E752|nr:hypothetical protein [Tomitella biformata]
MSDIVIGILAILVGAVFCFRGIIAMRFVIAIWGAFVGLNLGAALVAAISGDGFFATAMGWTAGIVLAVVFSVLAYLYYAVAVVLAMSSVGFALGAGAMAALGVTWDWVIVLVGVVIGVLLAILTLAVDLPSVLLVILSALGGAVAIVGGVMLLFNQINTVEFDDVTVTSVNVDWWWYALYIVLIIAGGLAQSRMIDRERSMRQQWQSAPA